MGASFQHAEECLAWLNPRFPWFPMSSGKMQKSRFTTDGIACWNCCHVTLTGSHLLHFARTAINRHKQLQKSDSSLKHSNQLSYLRRSQVLDISPSYVDDACMAEGLQKPAADVKVLIRNRLAVVFSRSCVWDFVLRSDRIWKYGKSRG